jgi:hypothetical protein
MPKIRSLDGQNIATYFPSAVLTDCRLMHETHVQELMLGIIFVQ